LTNNVIGHTQTDSFFFTFQNFWHLLAGR
jgi:hypothetical protein